MQAGRRYTFSQTVKWTRKAILVFIVLDTIPVLLYHFLDLKWVAMPWQPLALIGIAVAFYLGFKNNSSYERLWEARKIWGGIVNGSRTFTVMVRDFINNDHALVKLDEVQLSSIRKKIVHRHIAWLYALSLQLRKVMPWEHSGSEDRKFRTFFGLDVTEESFDQLKPYLNEEDFRYVSEKGNRASHLLSLQSAEFKGLRQAGLIEDFRHMELANMIKEFYTLQGKSERIKNFPFPRQYASTNFFFVCIFLLLLPFGMLSVFAGMDSGQYFWLAIPFSILASWVFWMMEAIGEYSENPFEGSYNDVPISAISRSIEIDIRQMLDEPNDILPKPLEPMGEHRILS